MSDVWKYIQKIKNNDNVIIGNKLFNKNLFLKKLIIINQRFLIIFISIIILINQEYILIRIF